MSLLKFSSATNRKAATGSLILIPLENPNPHRPHCAHNNGVRCRDRFQTCLYFIGANDGKNHVLPVSRLITHPHLHEDKFYSSCFACCGGLCRYQGTRSPCRFPLNPSEPPPKVDRPLSNEII